MLHRSYLYAPGSAPEVMDKALTSGADAVVLDLEDAVVPEQKVTARDAVAAAIGRVLHDRPDVHVRINLHHGGFDLDDLRTVVVPGLDAIRLPKVEVPDHVAAVARALDDLERHAGIAAGHVRLYPTIESAGGLSALPEIARSTPRVARVCFGSADFVADIGAQGDDALATLYARSQLVVTSRATRIGPPVDSVYTRLRDLDGLADSARHARALGFFGKSVIHPDQLAAVHAVFTPSDDDISWARRVIGVAQSAHDTGHGGTTVDGEFVDAAIVDRARRLLDLVKEN